MSCSREHDTKLVQEGVATMRWFDTGWTGSKSDQISWGVFLIGLGLMLANVIPWWPGVLFVGGAASLATALAERKRGWALLGSIWLFGLGLFFSVGFSWPLLLVIIGASMLFRNLRGHDSTASTTDHIAELASQSEKLKRDKVKNDDRSRSNEFDDEDDESYMLGDDGELIKIERGNKTPRARQL
jgi:hypothetical protein